MTARITAVLVALALPPAACDRGKAQAPAAPPAREQAAPAAAARAPGAEAAPGPAARAPGAEAAPAGQPAPAPALSTPIEAKPRSGAEEASADGWDPNAAWGDRTGAAGARPRGDAPGTPPEDPDPEREERSRWNGPVKREKAAASAATGSDATHPPAVSAPPAREPSAAIAGHAAARRQGGPTITASAVPKASFADESGAESLGLVGKGRAGGGSGIVAGGGIGTIAGGTLEPRDGLLARPPRPAPIASGTVRPITSDRIFRWLPPKPAQPPRDARYRSNYLPGRGYLEGLAASLSRPDARIDRAAGLGPDAVRSLLPPARGPVLPAPAAGRSLDVAVDQQYPLVPPGGTESVLVVRLRAAEGTPRPRPPLRLHLVLDASGSMRGEGWAQVCAAVRDVATRLTPDDLMSVVTYDDVATALGPPVPGGPAAIAVADKVCALRPRRETNIFAGLTEGYAQARAVYSAAAVNRVVLMSDGMPTRGPTDLYSLTSGTTDAFGAGITTSTVGIGTGFDALIMGRIASEGGGNFHFVRDRAGVPAVFTDELHVLAREAAEVVEVRVRLDPAVRLVEVVGSEPLGVPETLRARSVEVATDRRLASEQGIARDRVRDLDAGIRFLVPSFRMGDEHAFVIRVGIPADPPPGRIASAEVRYKDMQAGRNVFLRADSVVGRAASRAEAEARVNHEATVAEARARAAYALQRASEYLDAPNLGQIRNELYGAAQALSVAAGRAGDATAQDDADRLRRMADAAGTGLGRPHVAYLASLYHYGWRTCGSTAWR